jgi:hypothetical protein
MTVNRKATVNLTVTVNRKPPLKGERWSLRSILYGRVTPMSLPGVIPSPSMWPPRRRRRIHSIERSTLHDAQPSEVLCTCGATVTGANAAEVAEAYRMHLTPSGKGEL